MKKVLVTILFLIVFNGFSQNVTPTSGGGLFSITFLGERHIQIDLIGYSGNSYLINDKFKDSLPIYIESSDTHQIFWLYFSHCEFSTILNKGCFPKPQICDQNVTTLRNNSVYSNIIDFNNHSIFQNACSINFLSDSANRNLHISNINYINSSFTIPSITASIDLCYPWKTGEIAAKIPYLDHMQFLSMNSPFYTTISATANANDSFSYEAITPIPQPASWIMTNKPKIDQKLTYTGNYTFDKPLDVFCPNQNCSPNPNTNPPRGYSVNRLTGEIAFTCTENKAYWLKFRVNHFRLDSSNKYVPVGFIDKDLTYLFTTSNNEASPPTFSGPRIVQACTNDSLRFEIAINDGNTSHPDSLTEISLGVQSNLPPDAKIYLKDSSASNKILVVEWPQTKTIYPFKPTNYFLLLTAGYKSCGVLRDVVAYYTSTIYVHPKPIPKAKVDSVSRCGVVYFSSNKFTNSPYTLQWSIKNMADTAFTPISSAVADFLPLYKAGYYVLKLTANVTSLQCFGYDYDTFFVNEPMAILSSIQAPASVCNNQSLQALVRSSNLVFPASFLWSYPGSNLPTNDSSISFNPSASGKLLLRITDARGCEKTDSVSLIVHPSPVFQLPKDTILCQGQQVTLVSPIASDSTHSLLWLPDSTTNTSLLVNSEKNVVLQVLNQFGCSSSDTLFVGVNPLPSPDSLSLRVCAGSLATLKSPVPPAFSSINFVWKQNNNTIATDSILQRTLLNNAAYTLDYNYTFRGKTCSQSHNFFVVALPKPKPNFTLSDTALCLRNNLFTATDLSPAAAARTWINPDGGSSSDSLYQFSLQNHGSFSLGLALVNAQGCSDTLFKPLRTLPNPVAFANLLQQRPCFADNFVEVDFGASIASGSVASRSILWGNGKSNSISPASQIYSAPGSYNAMVIATSNRACTDTLLVPLQVLTAPSPSLSVLKACENDSLVLLSSNPHSQENTHFLYLNQVLVDSASLPPNQSNTWYSNIGSAPVQAKLIARSSQGCTDSISLSISPNPSPRASIQAVLLRDQKLAYRFTGSGSGSIAQWQWFSSQGNSGSGQVWEPRFSDTGMTTITLRVSSPQGCSSDTSIVVPVYDKITLFVPNAFSPNADGINDTWKVGGMLLFQDFSIKVFNRWGQQVWQATKATDEWNGEGAINGAYLYILSARDILGQLHELQGMLYLER